MTHVRSGILEHAIGVEGLFVLRLRSGAARLRGTDGDTVRVIDEDGRDLVGAPEVELGSGSLVLSVTKGGGGRSNGGRDAHLEVDLPRRATVVVEAGSADLVAEDLTGEQRYQTVSGDLTLRGVGGQVAVEAVSGDVRLSAAGELRLRARTVSGDLEARAPRFAAVSLTTTSGDVSLVGELLAGGDHHVETLSGDTLLDLAGGARVEVSSVTGDVSADVPHRTEGGRGRRIVFVGDAAATITARSMSGDVRIKAARPFDTLATGPEAAPADPAGPRPAEPPASPPPPTRPAPDASTVAIGAAYDDARLGILRGLERGDFDVAEAGRRLEALDAADVPGGPTDA